MLKIFIHVLKKSITFELYIVSVTSSKRDKNDDEVVMQINFTDFIEILILLYCNMDTKIERKCFGSSTFVESFNIYKYVLEKMKYIICNEIQPHIHIFPR